MASEDSTTVRLSGAEAPSTPTAQDVAKNPFLDPNAFRLPIIPRVAKPVRPEPPADLRPRRIKMGSRSYYDSEGDSIPVPYLRLVGKWLARAGFPIDANLHVTVEMGRLVIESVAPELIERTVAERTRNRYV
jgi:hypothetical protein